VRDFWAVQKEKKPLPEQDPISGDYIFIHRTQTLRNWLKIENKPVNRSPPRKQVAVGNLLLKNTERGVLVKNRPKVGEKNSGGVSEDEWALKGRLKKDL